MCSMKILFLEQLNAVNVDRYTIKLIFFFRLFSLFQYFLLRFISFFGRKKIKNQKLQNLAWIDAKELKELFLWEQTKIVYSETIKIEKLKIWFKMYGKCKRNTWNLLWRWDGKERTSKKVKVRAKNRLREKNNKYLSEYRI